VVEAERASGQHAEGDEQVALLWRLVSLIEGLAHGCRHFSACAGDPVREGHRPLRISK
jgi:hypothetical protein